MYRCWISQPSPNKKPGNKPNPPRYVGRGKSSTLSGSLIELYATSQQRVSWGHVTALVLSESMLQHDRLSQVFDMTNRSQEIRYTKWIYGTKISMKDLFTVSPFFQLSPLHSLLHEPEENYEQFSFIPPIQFVNFIRQYRDKAATVTLPTLHITNQTWTENLKQHPLLEVNGGFLLKNQEVNGWLSRNDLLGARWLATSKSHAALIVKENDEAIGSISLQRPQHAIEILRDKGEIGYRIKLNVTGTVQNMYKKVSVAEMREMTEKTLRDELMNTFHKGVKLNADPFQLSVQLHRKDPSKWKELAEQKLDITDESLREVDVNVDLRFWGQRKNLNR